MDESMRQMWRHGHFILGGGGGVEAPKTPLRIEKDPDRNLRADLEVLEKRLMSFPYRESKHSPSAVRPKHSQYTDYASPAPVC